jgi:hypothetical protein
MPSHFSIPFEEFVRTEAGQALIRKTTKKVGKHLPGFPQKLTSPDRMILGVLTRRRCRIEECDSGYLVLTIARDVEVLDVIVHRPLSERALRAYCRRDHLQTNDLRIVAAAVRLLEIPRRRS